jgi:CcmD family protein
LDARNFTYMFYGFLAAWVILTGYVMTIAARERKLRAELRRVEEMLSERARK